MRLGTRLAGKKLRLPANKSIMRVTEASYGSAMNMKNILEPIRRFRSEHGQAVTEYALLALWTVIIILATYKALQLALLDSYQQLASLICLPIP